MITECLACKNGWHAECIDSRPFADGFSTCCCYEVSTMAAQPQSPIPAIQVLDTRRAEKADEDIKDQTSTGRKRAAAMYPLPSVESGGMVCEWANLAMAGGGVQPIVGCEGNVIADTKEKVLNEDGSVRIWPGNIHHGPDKSTLNNVPSNVHRVCPVCHNRWHALNDPYYSKIRPDAGMPHIPLSGEMKLHDAETQASPMEIAWSRDYWAIPTRKREKVPYRMIGNTNA